MKKTLCTTACFAGALLVGTGHASAQEVSPPVPARPPPPAAAPAPPDAAPHTVGAGEHLSAIAQARLGEDERWVEIYAVNQDTLGDPDQIEVGQVLRIPSGPVEVPPGLLANLAPAPVRSSGSAEGSTSASSRTVRPGSGSSGGAGGDLAGIRQCESGGDYQAVGGGGQYRGAYQFDRQTWASVGGSGDPAAASPAEQDARASQLRSQRGSNPWPNCA